MAAEAHGVPVDVAERLARRGDIRLRRSARVEPRPLHALEGAVVSGDGGDERRQAAEAGAVAVAQGGVETQRREAAAVDGAGLEIVFGVGVVDGAALPPKAARRPRAIIAAAVVRAGRARQGKERARLVERRAQGGRADGDAHDVEQVAMLACGGVGPLADRAGRREAEEKRAPPRAARVAGDPVSAAPAPVGQVSAARRLGVARERGGDIGSVHDASPPSSRNAPFRPRSAFGGRGADRRRARRAPARRSRLRPAGKKKGPTRAAPAQSGGNVESGT